MHHRRLLAALVSLVMCAAARPAIAECTEPAAPGVNWVRCYLDGRDLSQHDLTGARLIDSSFQRAVLVKTIFAEVSAYRAKFISAEMKEAILDQGNFSEADFTKADLTGASLKNADLRRARFFRANLRGADLSGARTTGADFLNADLSQARWTDGKRLCAEGSIGQCN